MEFESILSSPQNIVTSAGSPPTLREVVWLTRIPQLIRVKPAAHYLADPTCAVAF